MPPRRRTRLDDFMTLNGVRPAHLERDSGVSRQHLYRLRRGTAEPTLHVMVALTTACRRIMRRPVRVADLFDIGEAMEAPKIETVGQVTIEHGLAFAQGWYEGDMADACEETGIMMWPDGDVEMKETQLRCHDLADEICANVFGLMKRQIAEAFVRAANDVLDREHRR